MDNGMLIYGLAVAWLALALYLVSMAGRQRKLVRDLANVRAMLDADRGSGHSTN